MSVKKNENMYLFYDIGEKRIKKGLVLQIGKPTSLKSIGFIDRATAIVQEIPVL